jgi:hypothetical protein
MGLGCGIVGRDVSLENVMLDGQGRCAIIDMGMCTLVAAGAGDGACKGVVMGPLPACGKPGYLVSVAIRSILGGYSDDSAPDIEGKWSRGRRF